MTDLNIFKPKKPSGDPHRNDTDMAKTPPQIDGYHTSAAWGLPRRCPREKRFHGNIKFPFEDMIPSLHFIPSHGAIMVLMSNGSCSEGAA